MVEAVVGSVASSVVGNALNKKSKSKANQIAGSIVPETIDTGRVKYNTQTGVFDIDPMLRDAGDMRYMGQLNRALPQVRQAYGRYDEGLAGLRGDVSGMRESYIDNFDDYSKSMLDPIREGFDARQGQLETSLARTGVRGSFAEQQRTNLTRARTETVSKAKSRLEQEKIQNLSKFLEMDANLLDAGLRSETGRIELITALEESLRGVSSDQLAREIDLLGIPAQFISGNAAAAGIRSNAEGVYRQGQTKMVGDILGAIDTDFFSGSDDGSTAGSYDDKYFR